MVKDVKVYSRPSCAPCKALKMWLNRKDIKFSEVNVDEDQNAQREAFAISGYSIVPITVITKTDGSQSFVSGYNLGALAAAL